MSGRQRRRGRGVGHRPRRRGGPARGAPRPRPGARVALRVGGGRGAAPWSSRRWTAGSTDRVLDGLELEQQRFADSFGTPDDADRRAVVPRARPRQGRVHLRQPVAPSGQEALGGGPGVDGAAAPPRRPARRGGRRPRPRARSWSSAARMRASSSPTRAARRAARARRVDSRCARWSPMAAQSSSTPSPVGGGGGDDRRAPRASVGEVEHPLEVAPGLVDAGTVGLVDHEHVGDLEQARLVGLHRVAPARGSPPRRWCRRRRPPPPRPGPTPDGLDEDPRPPGGVEGADGLERWPARGPPRWPRVAIDRMNTPASPVWSCMRTRSPRMAPPENGDDGSMASTATVTSSARMRPTSALVRVDLPGPGRAR